MIEIQTIEVNHFQVNCYILYDEATHQCAIVDPGAESNYEEAQVTQFIDEQGLTPTMILLTHAHVDHIAGLKQRCERYKLPVTLHSDGAKLLSQAAAYGSVMDYFEIFMERMILCRKAAEKLGMQFKLMINENQLL